MRASFLNQSLNPNIGQHQSGPFINKSNKSSHCCIILPTFPSSVPPLFRPRKVNHRHYQPSIAAVRDTSIGIIPGQKCRQDSKEPASLKQLRIGFIIRFAVKVSNPREKKGDVNNEEKREEGNSGF